MTLSDDKVKTKETGVVQKRAMPTKERRRGGALAIRSQRGERDTSERNTGLFF